MKNTIFEDIILLDVNLALFGEGNTNTTASEGLSEEMKTYYSDYLIDQAEPELVHDQFGQKQPIPKNGGKTIQFRKYSPLPKLTTPLEEGKTPDGQTLNMTIVEATVAQYGGYIELSDMLLLTAIDNNLVQATKLLGGQAGRTLDTITREVLAGGTNVQYAEGQVKARNALVGGGESGNHYLTVNAIRMAVRTLKRMNAPRKDGGFVAIIHPDCSYDLMSDPNWKYPHQYQDTSNIYEGEIGKIEGVRFVETSEAKIFEGENLAGDSRNLTVKTAVTTANAEITVSEAISAEQATALAGRKVIIDGVVHTINSASSNTAGNAKITLSKAISVAANTIIYPGEAGAEGRAVYATLVLGDDAYGVTNISDGGLQHIVKQLGSAGTADPLNQRATAGWKATKTAVRLVEEYMVRIETTASAS